MSKILLIDIGGTNIRYALAEDGSNYLDSTKKIPLDTIDNFHAFISNIVSSKNIDNLVISAAGPKINGNITMTNRDLSVNEQELKDRLGLKSCSLLNDWESIGYSLSDIKETEIGLIKNGNPFNGNTFFIGPGTGLGAAFKMEGGVVVPTEIGNTTGLTNSLLLNYGIEKPTTNFVTLEDVVSGSAISKIYEYKTSEKISSENVVKLFREGDKTAKLVIDGFTKSLAEVISDMALNFISGNGVYIAGSLMRTIVELMDKDLFVRNFMSNKKGIHKDLLEMIPIGMINREHACLLGNLNYYNLHK